MDDLVLVDIFHRFDELVDVITSFDLMQSLSPLHEVREGLVLADVEHDVYILFVFEVAIKSADVFIVQ